MRPELGTRQLVGTVVLVVEDNETNLKLFRDVLEHHGYCVISATDGEAGVEMARRCRPSLVLMDLQLPKLDGFAATREIRRDLLIGRVPIAAVTGFAMAGDRERALQAGCDEVLTKPVNIAEFVTLVKRLAGPANFTE